MLICGLTLLIVFIIGGALLGLVGIIHAMREISGQTG
ncbi:hypothetical protein AEYBE204_10360 [Asticcacaulis sp. YBE204]|nr:hypothetical protein AEYBE204_10360 [Asticcacaulis sp. YBE204]